MLLLIPGPVTTDARVRGRRGAGLCALGQRFPRTLPPGLRRRAARACARPDEHVALALPGCGHFAVEAAIRTLMPPGGRLLVPSTGAYANRLQRLAVEPAAWPCRCTWACATASIRRPWPRPWNRTRRSATWPWSAAKPAAASATMRPPSPASRRRWGGASTLGLRRAAAGSVGPAGRGRCGLTANKCLEGLPGAAFVVARRDLDAAQGRAGSWSLDLADIYQQSLQPNAGPRFTPPAPTLAAFAVALALS